MFVLIYGTLNFSGYKWMRRTDELRKKFAAKGKASSRAAEGEKMAFVDRLNEILAAEKHARATSKVFIDKLFCEFEAARPAEMDEWIRTKIADLFISIAEPPRWSSSPRGVSAKTDILFNFLINSKIRKAPASMFSWDTSKL